MLNENIVSLLIPCYNGEQFVERCLINVLEQEYAQYIELILVNDGSTDKTEEIIRKNTLISTLAYKIIVIDHFPISESGKIMYAKLLE